MASRILIVTQAIDQDDPVLGFFVAWVRAIAKEADRVEAVCLAEGAHDLPENVRVHTLGKERGRPSFGSLAYASRFFGLAWRLRNEYDLVFVHMNQEYVLIAGWLWKLLRKPVYMWRNHHAGSWLTDIAVAFCTNVFCTSRHSYTARFKKTKLMPVGVDTERFHPDASIARKPRSLLSLGRVSPAKRIDLLIGALAKLSGAGVEFSADIVGSPKPEHRAYYRMLEETVREKGLSRNVSFHPGVANHEAPAWYSSHEIFVNASPSGMFDKTLFEAAACGCVVLSSSEDFAELAGQGSRFDSQESLAKRLEESLENPRARPLDELVERHSLTSLAAELAAFFGDKKQS